MAPIIIPLFVSAARRASDLALAMDARCYNGGSGRTKMKPLEYKGRDIAAYLVMAGYIAVIIITGNICHFNWSRQCGLRVSACNMLADAV